MNGVSTSIETFRRQLAGLGVDVRLVVPRYGAEPDEPGVVRVPGWPIPGDPEDRLPKWRAMRSAVAKAALGCDVMHVQTPFTAHCAGLGVGRSNGLPVLATYHTLFEEYVQHYLPLLPSGWTRAAARRWSRQQCNALDALVVPTSAMRERLAEYGVVSPMHVLPTGIPLERFRTGDGAAFRAAHGIRPDRPVALYVGRVAHEKNIGFLLEAAQHARQRVGDLLLLITGEGPALPELRERVRAMGQERHVRFLGYLDRRVELPSCYKAANLFVLASRTETQGLVLLEAMAAGVPVMALSAMGTADVLAGGGAGCLTPPDDALAFGEAMAGFFMHPQAWPRMAADAERHASRWSDLAMARRLSELYQALLLRHEIVTQTT